MRFFLTPQRHASIESCLADLFRRAGRRGVAGRRRGALGASGAIESLESRLALAASVTTDLQDYAPGQTALISAFNDSASGVNFAVGETVRFQVTRTDGIIDFPGGNLPWVVVDGVGGFDPYVNAQGITVRPDTDGVANGRIGTTWFVEDQYANSALMLTAKGNGSGAVAKHAFTDAVVAGVADDGSGTMTRAGVSGSSTSPYVNTTGLQYKFSFRNPATDKDFDSGSTLTILVPSGWTTPQTGSASTAGYLTVAGYGGGSASITSVESVTDGTLITVSFIALGSAHSNNGFNLFYGGVSGTVTAPCTSGTYTFLTKTAHPGGTLTAIAVQPFIVVQPALPVFDHFAFTTVPATATVGVAENVTVTAVDQYGATFTGYTGTMTLSSSDTVASLGLSALPQNYTFTAGSGKDNGVHTFAVTFGTIGLQTLRAVDGAKTATSSAIDVSGTPSMVVATTDPAVAGNNLNYATQGQYRYDVTVQPGGINWNGGTATMQAQLEWAAPGSNSYTPLTATVGVGSGSTTFYYDASTQQTFVDYGTFGRVYLNTSTTFNEGAVTSAGGALVSGTAVHGLSSGVNSFADHLWFQNGVTSPAGSYRIVFGSTAATTIGGNPYTASDTETTTPLTVHAINATVTINDTSKVYGSANPALDAVVTGLANGDSLVYSLATTALQASNVGSYPITGSANAADNPNYVVAFVDGALAISKATPSVAYAGYAGGTYDGNAHTRTVTVTGVGSDGTIYSASQSGTNAGSYSQNWSFGDGNYSTVSGAIAFDIAKLHVTGTFTAQGKTYDGSTAATVLTQSPGAIIGGDAVTLVGGTATFDTKNVGTGKIVTLSGASLSGAAAGNYLLDGVSTTTASVTARALAIAATAANKTYDGNTTAAVTFTDNRVPGDLFQIAYGSATFDTALAGVNKPVTVTGISISGVDAGNYVWNTSASTTATILPATTPRVDDDSDSCRSDDDRSKSGTKHAEVRYVGATTFVTSSASATTAQVTLAASVRDARGAVVANATVDFIDAATGKVLAKGVKTSANGTASAVVTLSTGTYGSQLYNILVKLTGDCDNDSQKVGDKSASIVVSRAAASNEIIGGGTIASTTSTAGSLAASGVTTWSVGVNSSRSGSNVAGQVALAYRLADGSLVTIKSSALSSMTVTNVAGGKNVTINAKAVVSRTGSDGKSIGSDASVTVRVDMVSVNGVNQIGFTVLSTGKDTDLYYASAWVYDTATKTWKTRVTTLSSGTIAIN